MKKNVLVLSLFAVLMLSVVSVEGALRPGANTAGYHNVLYTESIQTADDADNYVDSNAILRVLPQTFIVGWGVAGGSLNFVGDASGNYVINAGGSLLTFSDNVLVNGYLSGNHLRVNGYGPVIDAAGYWVGRNIDSSRITINSSYNTFATAGSCPAGQYVIRTTSTGVVCSGVTASEVSGDVVAGSCPVGQVVMNTTTSGVQCVTLPTGGGGAAVGSCPANQYVVSTTSSGVVCSGVTATQVTGDVVPGSCPVGQVVMNTTTSGVQCVALPVGGASQWTTSGTNIYSNVAGNVGIGTTTPAQKLDVTGNARVSGSVTASTMNTTNIAISNRVNAAQYCDLSGRNCLPAAGCSEGQILVKSGTNWVCQNFIQLYQCPRTALALQCNSIQLLRNGVEYCHGQISSGTSCYYLTRDGSGNCNWNGIWGVCTPLGTTPPVCGDGTCNTIYESCGSCVADCGACASPGSCSTYNGNELDCAIAGCLYEWATDICHEPT